MITEGIALAGAAGMVLGLTGGAAATDWTKADPTFPEWSTMLMVGSFAVSLLALISLVLPEQWSELARLGWVFGSTAILVVYTGLIRWITVRRRSRQGDKR